MRTVVKNDIEYRVKITYDEINDEYIGTLQANRVDGFEMGRWDVAKATYPNKTYARSWGTQRLDRIEKDMGDEFV